MGLMKRLLCVLSVFCMFSAEVVWSCTIAAATRPDSLSMVAKNFDFPLGHGAVFLNKRGVKKVSLTESPEQIAASWVSRYASITFNQVGFEFPHDGMNERGLTVDILWLFDHEMIPAIAPLPSVNESQWIQFILDNAADLDEAVELAHRVKVVPIFAKFHYFVCDRSGMCAAIEYRGDKVVLRRGSDLPVTALANNRYDDTLAFMREHEEFGGSRPVPQDAKSPSRFVRAALALRNFPSDGDIAEAGFSLLEKVFYPYKTQWSIVYLPREGRIHFKTSKVPERRETGFSEFEALDCRTPAKMLRLDLKEAGNMNGKFTDYTVEANTALTQRNFFLPIPRRQQAAAYPQEYTSCEYAP